MTQNPTNGDSGGSKGGMSRRGVLRATGATALTGAVGSTVAGTASAHRCCSDCVRLGKVDRAPKEGDTYEFEHDCDTITIRVKKVWKEDGEVTCAKFGNETGSICGIDVKGGPATRTRRFDPNEEECGGSAFGGVSSFTGCAPEFGDTDDGNGRGPTNPNRDFYEISHLVFYVCVSDT
ncbi:hypothetical protein [Halosimplex sp. TS25]|uniref:hypothetical protein n=1 Tax=Halosimplex rarum TaxID=3396619 RepID=UPI0039E8D1E0